MPLVDTNALVDVRQDDPPRADWSIRQLRAQAGVHQLVANPVIYAEMSLSFSTMEALERQARTQFITQLSDQLLPPSRDMA